MKRILLVLIVSAAFLVGCKSDKPKVQVIKVAHGASESYHMHRALVKFKNDLEATGEFKVELYPSSQFGNDAEMIESVKTGDITMAVPPSSFLTDEVPSMAFIELPYVFTSRQNAINTLNSDWGKEQLDLLKKAGLYGLGYMENGMRHLTNSKKAVRSPDDLQGLKLRTMQVSAHVYYWNSLKSSAEGAPFSELYTNLSTKVFDGQENPIAHIYSQKFYEVQKFLTLTGHCYTAYIPVMQLDYWNSLTDKQQQMITVAFSDAVAYQMELIDKEEGAQLKEMAEDSIYKTEIIYLTADELQKFINSAEPTLNKYKNDLGEAEYEKFKAAARAAN